MYSKTGNETRLSCEGPVRVEDRTSPLVGLISGNVAWHQGGGAHIFPLYCQDNVSPRFLLCLVTDCVRVGFATLPYANLRCPTGHRLFFGWTLAFHDYDSSSSARRIR